MNKNTFFIVDSIAEKKVSDNTFLKITLQKYDIVLQYSIWEV